MNNDIPSEYDGLTYGESLATLMCKVKELENTENCKITVSKKPIYETRDIWAEEGGAVDAVISEWSFGNGATGFMGLPIDDGWEVIAMGFMADTYAATATVTVDLMNYGGIASNSAANTITDISLTSATDGGGVVNNARKYVDLSANPVIVPSNAILGFITRAETGTISDARVYARLRRQVGTCINEIYKDGVLIEESMIEEN